MAVLAVISGVLITLSFRGDNLFQRAEDGARSVLSAIGDFAGSVFSPLTDAWNATWDYDDLQQENRQLQQQIDEMQAAEFTEQAASAELERLSADLDLTPVGGIPRVAAKVVVPLGNFSGDTIQLSKGATSGLEEGMPVVVKSGLVGRLVEVRQERSFVRPLTSPSFLVGVRFLSNDLVAPAVTQPDGDLLRAELDVSFEPPQVGTLAVTSGLERSVYPPDLPVGLVEAVETDESTLTNVIFIRPVVNTERLSFVSVLDYDTGLQQ